MDHKSELNSQNSEINISNEEEIRCTKQESINLRTHEGINYAFSGIFAAIAVIEGFSDKPNIPTIIGSVMISSINLVWGRQKNGFANISEKITAIQEVDKQRNL